jgi:hypothetical protein
MTTLQLSLLIFVVSFVINLGNSIFNKETTGIRNVVYHTVGALTGLSTVLSLVSFFVVAVWKLASYI